MLLASPASAGVFRLSLTPIDNDSIDIDKVRFEGSQLKVEPDSGVRRNFSFVEPGPGVLDAITTIVMPAPGDDFGAFALDLRVPFGWQDEQETEVAAAIASNLDIRETRNFVLVGGAWRLRSNSLVDLVELNQQSRLLARTIIKEGGLNAEDAKIVLWFLVSSKELTLNRFVVPDAEMKRAAGVIKDILENQSGLLDATDREVATVALADFDQSDRTQLHKLTLMVHERFRDNAEDRCARADALDRRMIAMSEAEISRLDPTRFITLTALRFQLICVQPHLTFDPTNREALEPATIVRASLLSARTACALATYTPDDANAGLGTRTQRLVEQVNGAVAFDADILGIADQIAPQDCDI